MVVFVVVLYTQIEMDMKEFKVGTIAPVWIPDGRVSMCTVCQEEFRLVFRRHHCRGCGKVGWLPSWSDCCTSSFLCHVCKSSLVSGLASGKHCCVHACSPGHIIYGTTGKDHQKIASIDK